jgi:membrane-bound serine protease (ClpP class)
MVLSGPPDSTRMFRRLFALIALALGASILVATPSGAAPASPTQTDPNSGPTTPPVDVLQVSGSLDGIVARKIEAAIKNAAANGSQALVLQVNSKGSVLSDKEASALATAMKNSKVPIAMWVGPSGARAYGHMAQLMAVVPISGMAPGTRIGRLGDPLTVDGTTLKLGEANDRLRDGTMNDTEARSAGAIKPANDTGTTAVLGEMIVSLDGETVNGVELATAVDIVDKAGRSGRSTSGITRFVKLGLIDQTMHTFASPPVAYLMMVIGLGLLVFEFFTAGVGVAGVCGAIALIAGSYGLVAQHARPVGVALLLLAFLAFAVDVQTGVPRFWTGVGVVAFVISSLILFRDVRLSWVALLVGIGGVLLAFVSGMPSMVRTRFATPTIGREFMIGRTGTAIDAVSPTGMVLIGDGRWRARTNRATPIAAGDEVRVVAIDGLTLDVEPLVGAARDYRERRPKADVVDLTADHADPA